VRPVDDHHPAPTTVGLYLRGVPDTGSDTPEALFSWGDFREGAAVTAAKRLDGVDLRVGIHDADTARVAAALGLDRARASEREIYLLEDLSGSPGLLSAAGTTARLVQIPRGHELVVQLRPVRQAQLGPDWLGFYSDTGHRLRISEEWTADRRIMTASLTARLDAAIPALAATADPDGTRPARGLLSAMQRDFLARSGLVVKDGGLRLLGPILELTWRLRRYDLDFLARRWTAHERGRGTDLDLIDLERASVEADAPFLLPALRSLAQRQGVDPSGDVEPVVVRAVAWFLRYRR
jgi:hypothetical protein